MSKIEDYRAHADECRSIANRAHSLTDRTMLMNMAARWESLAADRQTHIARQERMGTVDNVSASIPVDRLNAAND